MVAKSMLIVCNRIAGHEKFRTCCAGARVPLQAATAPAPSSSLPNADLLFIISANQVNKAPLLIEWSMLFIGLVETARNLYMWHGIIFPAQSIVRSAWDVQQTALQIVPACTHV